MRRPGDTTVVARTGPAYHAAPLAFNVTVPLNAGVGVVMMDRWDPEETLRLIEEYRITHTHMVATMFHRLLELPDDVKRRYDLSSLKLVMHGAAPCPVHVKHAIIDWLGPIVFEYYAATEGGGNYTIDAGTWLQKPGSVGRSPTPENTRVIDDAGNELGPGEVGTIYFRAPEVGRFEYFKSPEKTRKADRGRTGSTLAAAATLGRSSTALPSSRGAAPRPSSPAESTFILRKSTR
ncbi:MAG: AMP-binding protein [Gammaproteobacteria bacterium]|nr:AMP-binding protein [Gammaproteobacteria bacterium]